MTKKTTYAQHLAEETPQSEKLPGTDQVKNSAGGYSFAVDKWKKFDRFLILGTEGGSYYASEKDLTIQNAENLLKCVAEDGLRVVKRIVEVSDQGIAPKNDPAIFALAVCLKKGDLATKHAAEKAVPKVCRIGTHIFQLADAIKVLGGWGRITMRAVASWYEVQPSHALATNLVKYQQRGGWSHKDLLRKSHASEKVTKNENEALFRWVTRDGNLDAREVGRFKNWKEGQKLRTDKYQAVAPDFLPKVIEGFEKAKNPDLKAADIVKLVQDYGLPRECIPTQHLKSTEVWEALLTSGKGMPFTAMIRNLGKMSAVGLIAPMSNAEKFVAQRLADQEGLQKARVHPIQVLLAQAIYASGRGVKGDLSWAVSTKVIDALNEAFYLAFKNVEPTGKRRLIGLDVSGSMSGGMVAGTPLTPRAAAAALAMVTARTEETWYCHAFSNRFMEFPISPKERLDSIVKRTEGLGFEGTDCSLPMVHALKRKIPVDCFEVYTDSETWAGAIHPTKALQQYRKETGIPAKLIVVGLVANDFTIADPNDAGMMDVVGFDASAPSLMADFIRD